jgi:hypothetical protein
MNCIEYSRGISVVAIREVLGKTDEKWTSRGTFSLVHFLAHSVKIMEHQHLNPNSKNVSVTDESLASRSVSLFWW